MVVNDEVSDGGWDRGNGAIDQSLNNQLLGFVVLQ